MTTATIRKKLHDYIDAADDKKLEAIYNITDNEITGIKPLSRAEKIDLVKKAANDPLFLADLKEVSADFEKVDHEI